MISLIFVSYKYNVNFKDHNIDQEKVIMKPHEVFITPRRLTSW